MIITNQSLLLTTLSAVPGNTSIEVHETSSSSIIITIIILSCLSISGWIFMSYALFGRSEAYRTKPDDQLGSSNTADNAERGNGNDFFGDFDG